MPQESDRTSPLGTMNLGGVTVLRTDAEIHCPLIDAALTAAGAELVLLPDTSNAATLIDAVRDVDLVLTCYAPLGRPVIAAARRLRGIVKYGVGVDAIDIDAAIAHGIPVVNVPAYAERTVAEGAFCLLIALARRLVPLDRAMHREGWVWPTPERLGTDIHGKTLGIVGTGRIGRALARMAGAGFGARVIGHDPHVRAETMRAAGVEKVDALHELLERSDFVSLHAVLTEETRGLIGEAEFAAMRRRPLFVNVARGALVDERALLRALADGRIAGAGLDTFVDEPLGRREHALSELYARDDVILTPHLTFYTHEAMQRLERETLERCAELLRGEPVTVASSDARLRAQRAGVRFVD